MHRTFIHFATVRIRNGTAQYDGSYRRKCERTDQEESQEVPEPRKSLMARRVHHRHSESYIASQCLLFLLSYVSDLGGRPRVFHPNPTPRRTESAPIRALCENAPDDRPEFSQTSFHQRLYELDGRHVRVRAAAE